MKKIDYNLSPSELNFGFIVELLMGYWKNIAINIFEWKRKNGEPISTISDGLTSQIIEEELFDYGKALFLKDLNGHLCLPAVPVNKLNVYWRPQNYRAIGFGYTKQTDLDHAVLIKNNSLMNPTADIILYYVRKLANIEMTKDLRIDTHKTPIALDCTEDTLLTAKNMFKKVKANEPVIFKNKSRADAEVGISAVDMGVEFINDKLEDEYHNYEARILTILGLDNYVEDKKERVQSAEVESQQEYIISSFRASLRERQEACERINKMFGLDLVVDYVKDNQIETDEEVEEVKDEQLYSRTENNSEQ